MKFRLSTTEAFLLGSLLAIPQIASSAIAGQLQAVSPWANPTVAGQQSAAGYLVLRNSGTRPRELSGASSPVAQTVEVHGMALQRGVARMRKLERVIIPARGELRLAPGSSHLMLIGLRRQLVAGNAVPVTLNFRDGTTIEVVLRVGSSAFQQPTQGSNHDHH
jgi:copper(I)-binding protein